MQHVAHVVAGRGQHVALGVDRSEARVRENTEFSTFASLTSAPSAPGAAIGSSRPLVVPQSSSRMMTSCETSTRRRVR